MLRSYEEHHSDLDRAQNQMHKMRCESIFVQRLRNLEYRQLRNKILGFAVDGS